MDGLVDLDEVLTDPPLYLVTVRLGAIPYLYCVDHITEIVVTHKLAEGALNSAVQVSDEEVESHQLHLQTP